MITPLIGRGQDGLMTQLDDMTSIDKVTGGNPDAFRDIVTRYQRPLFVYIGNIVRHRQTAEDMLQDVFLAVYVHLDSYQRQKGNFSTWLFQIARNRCLNELKKKKERLEPDLVDIPGPDSPVEALMKKEAFRQLDEAMNQLSFRDLSIFILAELEGMSYEEISRIEKIRMGTVKSRLSRIRKKLKGLLEKQGKRP